MNSETDVLKTNEFLRRRKLRLQQVREQSKDIAKKIRQRTKAEKLQQVVDIDAKKQQEYLKKQEKLVKHLEVLYVRGLENVGAGHQSATDLANQEQVVKVDLSKARGKEATAELRRIRQQKLDEQKKLLDRKLHAREAANELSREKSSILLNKITAKPTKATEDSQKPEEPAEKKEVEKSNDVPEVKSSDMATQWDVDAMFTEWEPTVPTLSLPKDDKDSILECDITESKSDKSKRLDLFAVSKEMPSSLRGQHGDRNPVTTRPSLTLVSEYLQNRKLRLRETAVNVSKPADDIHCLRQTIQRTRMSKPDEVSGKTRPQDNKSSRDILNKKPSVTMYNHSTRDVRDMPCGDGNIVVRDSQAEEDAYSHAFREASIDNEKENEHLKKKREMRNKVAMTKQNVEKEYKETINFLNSLPKSSGNVIKTAYMDDHRQQEQKAQKQRKMQHEFRKIERESKSHNNSEYDNRSKSKSPNRSKSPAKSYDKVLENRDFQYSWLPIPEGDGNLAVHTIPNTAKEGKNSVTFSHVDSYHEYRSRHKHTPPTKDTTHTNRRQTVIIDKNTSDYTDTSDSDTSSIENLRLEKKSSTAPNVEDNLSDAERIIIYKILDSKKDKKCKDQTKLLTDIAKSLSYIQKTNKADKSRNKPVDAMDSHTDNTISLEQINEGVYKVVDEPGENVSSFDFAVDPPGPSKAERHSRKSTRLQNSHQIRKLVSCKSCCTSEEKSIQPSSNQNIPIATSTSSFETATNDAMTNARPIGVFMNLPDEPGQDAGKVDQPGPSKEPHAVKLKHCYCSTNQNNPKSTVLQRKNGEEFPRASVCKCCYTSKEKSVKSSGNQNIPMGTSTSSFKTATNDTITSAQPSSGDFIKLLDEEGHEAGKFFIGATGILNDNAYELIIQLRKKDSAKKEPETESTSTNMRKNQEVNTQNIEVEAASAAVNEAASAAVNEAASAAVNEAASAAVNEAAIDITEKTAPKPDYDSKNTETEESKDDNNSSDHIRLVKESNNNFDKVDKCVCTSFQSNDQVDMCDPVCRRATTTCTQTSSPRPYYHMSSSTSTAYMSPPEKILPKSITRSRPRSATFANEFCRRHSGCDCQENDGKNIVKEAKRQILTPPNTPLSNRSNRSYLYKQNCDPRSTKSCKSHCCKCASRDRLNDRTNGNYKTVQTVINKRPILKLNTHCFANASSKMPSKTSKRRHDVLSSNINPVVKKYVDRLLVLSKESIKALEVVDQNCSPITTPGSSIINVPSNIDERKSSLLTKISLEQIKAAFLNVMKENGETELLFHRNSGGHKGSKSRIPRKRSVHKVKSFNVSKHLLKKPKVPETKQKRLFSWTSTDENFKTLKVPGPRRVPMKPRSKSSPTPRLHSCDKSESTTKTTSTERNTILTNKSRYSTQKLNNVNNKPITKTKEPNYSVKTSSDSEDIKLSCPYKDYSKEPTSMSTQTNINIDDISFMRLAENKLNKMEKMADLTEKCTKRLSNLAKVLHEVRKNKSLAYGQISSSDSTETQSENKSDKIMDTSPVEVDNIAVSQPIMKNLPQSKPIENEKSLSEYISMFTKTPKSASFKIAEQKTTPAPNSAIRFGSVGDPGLSMLLDHSKRLKPPPALTRMNLKHGDNVVPHELSTVIEVDSPLSVKNKPGTSCNETKEGNNTNPREINVNQNDKLPIHDPSFNPDILQSNIQSVKHSTKHSSGDSNDDSKFQMIDLKQFNEIMLEPFISIQEYAKKFNVEPPDEGSNLEDLQQDEPITDEFSSLHSDGSLPDVIGELLKRNIITEPFKFDTVSNINSTTLSSESNISTLALSKIRKVKKKPSVTFQNKENIGETSDILSISSNPDLENAFKKLGMGWASSTLKKTKERLALSSSSNTSSSSTTQYILKNFGQDIPVIVTDSVSSMLNQSQKVTQNRSTSTSKHQQEILMNAMTVKEFLTNELAKKITFNNKSTMNDTEEEFVSLFETKMPEEIKQASETQTGTQREEVSIDSARSGANRARTSTPVQVYKCTTYHSSSSSNMSNGLFSNVDDISSVKMTSNSIKNHSTSEKDDLTIPNFSLRMKKSSDCSKSD